MMRTVETSLFGLQYVMTESCGATPPKNIEFRNTIILFMIDLGQVLRVMMNEAFGWSKETYRVSKHLDIVYNSFLLMSEIIPRYSFFILAFILVAVALADAFYCARLFSKASEIKKIGPVKVLRFLVSLVVCTLFSSTLEWLLQPLDCLVSDEPTFSAYFHVIEDCTPWAFPEIIFVIPTLVLIVLYVFFALIATYFSLGINPLSTSVREIYTARVEVLFFITKISASFLPFVAPFISTVGVSMILWIEAAVLFYKHVQVLPYYHHGTNMLRGGILSTVHWLAFSSVILSSIGVNSPADDNPPVQLLQWLMLGALPLAFMLGVIVVRLKKTQILLSLDRLRGEWETSLESQPDTLMLRRGSLPDETPRGAASKARRNSFQLQPPPPLHTVAPITSCPKPMRSTSNGSVDFSRRLSAPRTAAPAAKERDSYLTYFNPGWERKKVFESAVHAHTVSRVLLCRRDESELPLLTYVVNKAVDEYPDSDELQGLRVSLLRFVFRRNSEAVAEEKKLRGGRGDLDMRLDLRYVLYAVERKAAQDYAASNLGKGVVSAINLMEFDGGMQQAKTAHLQCIVEMSKFWSNVLSSKKHRGGDGADGADSLSSSVRNLQEFDRVLTKAKQEYSSLLDKYPQSVQLLSLYSSFCDAVLNNPKEADQLRSQARKLENGEDGRSVEEDDEVGGMPGMVDEGERECAQSCGDTSEKSSRTNAAKHVQSWAGAIFGNEERELRHLDFRTKVLLVILLALGATAFGVSQFWLFKDMAQRDVGLMNGTGVIRTWMLSSSYLLRSMILAAQRGDEDDFTSLQNEVRELAENAQERQWQNYEIIRTQEVRDFYYANQTAAIPTTSSWEYQVYSFWNFGVDMARRVKRATYASMEEFADPDYDVATAGEAKANISFLSENLLRSILQALEDIVMVYQHQMKGLWAVTQTVVIASTIGNLSVILLLALVAVRGVTVNIQRMQHLALAASLAAQLPSVTSRKLLQFYQQAELALRSTDDEDAEKLLIEQGPLQPSAMPAELTDLDEDDDQGAGVTDEMAMAVDDGEDEDESEDDEGVGGRRLSMSRRRNEMLSPEARKAAFSLTAANLVKLQQATKKGRKPKRDAEQEESVATGDDSGQDSFPGLVIMVDQELSDVSGGGLGPKSKGGSGGTADTQEMHVQVGKRARRKLKKAAKKAAKSGGAEEPSRRSSANPLSATPKTSDHADDSGEGSHGQGPVPIPKLPSALRDKEKDRGKSARRPSFEPAACFEPQEGGGERQTVVEDAPKVQTTGESSPQGEKTDGQEPEGHKPAKTDDSPCGDGGVQTGGLPLQELTDDARTAIRVAVNVHRPWYTRPTAFAAATVVICGLSVLFTVFPARQMNQLVVLAPTINQAGRRRSLVRACVHLARELVLDDGYLRMNKTDIASALHYYLEDLKRAHKAVRLGGDLGIIDGADERNPQHNVLMYGKGCPWRSGHGAGCDTPLRPGAAENGLHQLALTFYDAVGNVLRNYGPPPSEYTDAFLSNPRSLEELDDFVTVATRLELVATMDTDEDLKFILSCFNGDLYVGYATIVEIFDHELHDIVNTAVETNKLTFAAYVVLTCFGFYMLLFRYAVAHAFGEADKARAFVARVPSYVLSNEENVTIARCFSVHHL